MSDDLTWNLLLNVDKIWISSDINRRDIFTFLGLSSGKSYKFAILFGDMANMRIAKISHTMELDEPAVPDSGWVDIDPRRTVLSVDVIKNERGDDFIFPLSRISFYNSERAIRLIKLLDDYGLEFFEIEIDSNIFE